MPSIEKKFTLSSDNDTQNETVIRNVGNGMEKKRIVLKKITDHKYTILFSLILVFGTLLRIIQLGKVPGGYQMDEAYGAFNAYSLFHSGIDSTGHSYPVYFESWGGGQNALNSYLMLPLMLFTGGRITPLVVRLPQVIIAVLSLVSIYFLMKEILNASAGLWAMLLLSVCPWHIMMSRWGLESNLAPGFLLFGLTFFVYGLKKPKLLILSAFSYGLSLYCYATIWMIVPLLLILEWAYGLLTKTLKITRYFIIHICIIGVMAFPLMAFLLVNQRVIPEFSIGPFSVYAMTDFRVNEIASSFSDILYNFKNLLYLLYRQDVGRPYDVIMPFGFFGVIARVFIFLGVFWLVACLIRALWKRQTTLLWMIFIQLTGALLLGLLVTVGMTQINCIYLPLVMCGALCLSSLTEFISGKTNVYGKVAVSILVAGLLVGENGMFEKAYFTSYKELVSAYFQEGSEEAVQKAMEIAGDSGRDIEIEDAIKYPSVLLYGEIDAAEYLENRILSEAPPKPSDFWGKGIHFIMGIDRENVDRDKVYVIYYTDADKFDGFTLLPYQNWYVAY